MARPKSEHRAWLPWLITWVGLWHALAAALCAQTASDANGPSFSQSLSSGVQRVGQAIQPAPLIKKSDDPISLESPGKPGIELYVAVARLYEESGRFAEAESYYQRALQQAPKDLRGLLGYARLKDRTNEPQEALKLYQRAMQLHPDDPAVYNNLAVHYARGGAYREAIGALDRAVHLRPKEPRYRNNLAAMYIETGRPQEAFDQLRAVYDESVAHYNLGFLLHKKGLKTAAAQEFMLALRANPSFVQARQWVERLSLENASQGARAMLPTPPPQYIEPPAATTMVPAPPPTPGPSPLAPMPPQNPPAAMQYRAPAPQYGSPSPPFGPNSIPVAPPPAAPWAPAAEKPATADVRVLPAPPAPPTPPGSGWVSPPGVIRPADSAAPPATPAAVRRLPPVQDDPDFPMPELIAPAR